MKRDLIEPNSPSKRLKTTPWYLRVPIINWMFTKESTQSDTKEIEVPVISKQDDDCQIIEVKKFVTPTPSMRNISQTSTPKPALRDASQTRKTIYQTPFKTPLFQNIQDTPSHQARLSWLHSTTRSSGSSRSSRLSVQSHRLSSVRKQGFKKQSMVMENLRKQFVPGFKAAAKSGYTSTQTDYEGLIDYMRRVRQVEEQMGIPEPIPKVDVRDVPKPSRSKDTERELEWITELRQRINEALSAPEIPIEKLQIRDEKFRELVEKEKETQKQIQALLQPKKSTQDLFPPLSTEQIQKVDQCQRGEGPVVDKFSIEIKGKDLRTLYGSNWLNDEVINFYAELIMDRAKKYPDKYPKIHVFNTFFYHMLSTKGYKGVRRWTKKFDIFEKDYIIIPVHLGMHWCCSVIDFKHKKFIYYDSLYGNNPKCLKLLREYIEQESMDKKQVAYDLSEWQDETPKDIPAQENGYDCGVFTCMFMEFTAREEDFLFRQSHMPYLRKRIASEIINAELMAISSNT